MRAPTALGLLAVAAVGAAVGVAIRARMPEPVPAQPEPAQPQNDEAAATRAAPASAAGDGAATVAEAGVLAARRQPAPAPSNVGTAQAMALLARAGSDRSLALVTAEVLAVDTIARAGLVEGSPEHQDVTLRLLTESGDGALRRYATLVTPLCPAASQRLYGCSTPFSSLAPGEVRTFVLGRGRPDLGPLSKLAHRAPWLVLAGPEVARPDDPLLAKVPPELHAWLGRPLCNVFRARVCELREGGRVERDGRDLAREFDHLTVDVFEVVQQAGKLRLRGRIRLAPEPFVGKQAMRSLAVGREYWFATDEAALFQVLRAFAPAN